MRRWEIASVYKLQKTADVYDWKLIKNKNITNMAEKINYSQQARYGTIFPVCVELCINSVYENFQRKFHPCVVQGLISRVDYKNKKKTGFIISSLFVCTNYY